MFLYRPFLHSVAQSMRKTADKRSYACAAACISVSRNIVHITSDLRKKGLLVGAYWFTMYTTFFAIVSLIFYGLENPNRGQDMIRDAYEGKEVLASLSQRSLAADRCSKMLTVSPPSLEWVVMYVYLLFRRPCSPNFRAVASNAQRQAQHQQRRSAQHQLSSPGNP